MYFFLIPNLFFFPSKASYYTKIVQNVTNELDILSLLRMSSSIHLSNGEMHNIFDNFTIREIWVLIIKLTFNRSFVPRKIASLLLLLHDILGPMHSDCIKYAECTCTPLLLSLFPTLSSSIHPPLIPHRGHVSGIPVSCLLPVLWKNSINNEETVRVQITLYGNWLHPLPFTFFPFVFYTFDLSSHFLSLKYRFFAQEKRSIGRNSR